jgi:hypothetical protein
MCFVWEILASMTDVTIVPCPYQSYLLLVDLAGAMHAMVAPVMLVPCVSSKVQRLVGGLCHGPASL